MSAIHVLRQALQLFTLSAAVLIFAIHAPLVSPAKAQDVPSYSVQFIGDGFPTATRSFR